MFRHSLLVGFRNLTRFKSIYLINIIGLSTGLACALMVYLWVIDELNVDKFNEKDSQLFQVMKNVSVASGILTLENTPGRLAEAIAEEIPEIEYAVSVVPSTRWSSSKGIVSAYDTRVRADGQFVSKDYFSVFSIKFIQGAKNKLFSDKNNIAISEALATKLFNHTENVIGEIIEWDQERFKGHYMIIGVFEDPLTSSSNNFDILFNYDLFMEKNPKLENWSNSDPSTYVILKSGTTVSMLEGKIVGLIKNKNSNSKETLFLQQYSKRYLHNHYENGVPAGGRIEYVKRFAMIAGFLLVIACINFMNLSTAKASKRFKEIGIRKTLGARRRTLVLQYMSEAMLVTFVSAVMALLLVELLLPWVNEIAGKHLGLDFDVNLISGFGAIVLSTGFVSGSYPALYLSGSDPILLLKWKPNSFLNEIAARKALVIFQFALSVVMVVSVLIVYKQMEYVQTKNLGYNRDNVIYFEKGGKGNPQRPEIYENALESFLRAMKNIPGVLNASNFRHSIINRQGGTSDVNWPGKLPDAHIEFTDLSVGYDFIETLGIGMKEGRSFSRQFNAEKSSIILNEEAVQIMGLQEPVGKVVRIWGEDKEIIGVVKNFHFQPFYENIKPLFFDLNLGPRASKIIVKIKTGTENETIARLQKLYGEYNPGLFFEYAFLDHDYQLLYESENRMAWLSRCFAVMAILISCLGLAGLAAFATERRLKEIGIRKVLGATATQLVTLLSQEFVKLVLLANLIAWPIAYLVMNNWLQDFAYRIDIGWWMFALPGGLALMIALLTLSTQAIRAALANPVEALRYE